MMRFATPWRRGIVIICLCGAIILFAIFSASHSPKTPVTYSGKSLEAWFYGGRTNFFVDTTRKKAQDAIDAVGTNAFPFLLSNLRESHGNGNLYFRFYNWMPRWIQARLYYPILSDDIRAITLNHIRNMHSVSGEEIKLIADCIPELKNPRLRSSALFLLESKPLPRSDYLSLCRKLLNDDHPGIRVEAAIALAESGLVADPGEPRLFPILIAALESKRERDLGLEVRGYRYRQQPPGGAGPLKIPMPPGFRPDPKTDEQYLRDRIETALYRLERHLPQEQKARFRQAIKNH